MGGGCCGSVEWGECAPGGCSDSHRALYSASCGGRYRCLLGSEPVLLRRKSTLWHGRLGSHASTGLFEDALGIGSAAADRLERVVAVVERAQHLPAGLAPLSWPRPTSDEQATCLCTRSSYHVVLKLFLELFLLAFVKEPQAEHERAQEDGDGSQHGPDEAAVFFALGAQDVVPAGKERVEVDIRRVGRWRRR